jgi:hypothetical protein
MTSHRKNIIKETISDLLAAVTDGVPPEALVDLSNMDEEISKEMVEDAGFAELLADEDEVMEEAGGVMDVFDDAEEADMVCEEIKSVEGKKVCAPSKEFLRQTWAGKNSLDEMLSTVEIDDDKDKVIKKLRMEATIGAMENKKMDLKLRAEVKTKRQLQKSLKEKDEELKKCREQLAKAAKDNAVIKQKLETHKSVAKVSLPKVIDV